MSPSPSPESTAPATAPDPEPSSAVGCLGWLWRLIFRLTLLTVGSGAAFAVGIAIATRTPAEVDSPPLVEQVLQRLNTL